MPRRRAAAAAAAPQPIPLTELPSAFATVGLQPATARRGGAGGLNRRVQIWNQRQEPEQTRLAVLQHLASHCTAPSVPAAYADRHPVFLHDRDGPGQGDCIELRRQQETGIHPRDPDAGHGPYTWVLLGDQRAGVYILRWPDGRFMLDGKDFPMLNQKTRIGMDAHRLVCWLVHGPHEAAGPANASLHWCHNPACCKASHVRWGTQSENTVEGSPGSAEKKRKRDAVAGVTALHDWSGTWANFGSRPNLRKRASGCSGVFCWSI